MTLYNQFWVKQDLDPRKGLSSRFSMGSEYSSLFRIINLNWQFGSKVTEQTSRGHFRVRRAPGRVPWEPYGLLSKGHLTEHSGSCVTTVLPDYCCSKLFAQLLQIPPHKTQGLAL